MYVFVCVYMCTHMHMPMKMGYKERRKKLLGKRNVLIHNEMNPIYFVAILIPKFSSNNM